MSQSQDNRSNDAYQQKKNTRRNKCQFIFLRYFRKHNAYTYYRNTKSSYDKGYKFDKWNEYNSGQDNNCMHSWWKNQEIAQNNNSIDK